MFRSCQKTTAVSNKLIFSAPVQEAVCFIRTFQSVIEIQSHGGHGDKAMLTPHLSNFYTLPSCSPGHAITKNFHWASVALFLLVVVNFERYNRELNGKRA